MERRKGRQGMRCMLCGASRDDSPNPFLCRNCLGTTGLPRVVTVSQLAKLSPGLTEDKLRHYMKRKHENGLQQSGALYTPTSTNSVYIHLDRFEAWFRGEKEEKD